VIAGKLAVCERIGGHGFQHRRVRREDLLPGGAPGRPAYVLDAWQRGEADIYALADWLDLPLLTFVEARFEPPYAFRR